MAEVPSEQATWRHVRARPRPSALACAWIVALVATGAVAPRGFADEAPPCSLVPPGPAFVVAIGYGEGDEVAALREAREDARERLLGQVCAGYVQSRCARVGRFIRDWEQGEHDPAAGSVCAVAALERAHLESLERDTRTFRSQLDTLALASREAAGDRPLAIEAPVWGAQGCEAGATGAVVAAEVRNALARVEARVRIGPAEDDAPAIHLELAASSRGVLISGALRAGGQATGIGLPGTQVGWDVLGVPAVEPCADEAAATPAGGVVPARGTVLVDGVPVEETHWIGGCLEPDRGQRTAAELWGALGSDPSGEGDVELAALAQGYLGEARVLCEQYERFAIGAEAYARRSAELSRWFREVQRQLLGGDTDSAGRSRLLQGPTAVVGQTLTVSAARLDGVALVSGDPVTRDDRFKLHATITQPAHLYVIYENSAGETAVFPERSDGVLGTPGVPVQLPAPGFIFRVDEHGGRAEIVHVVASPHPLPVRARSARAIVGEARRTRGLAVEPETVFTDDGEVPWYGDPEATVSGYGAVLYTLVLDHR